MDKKPRLAVIIPCFNKIYYTQKTVESLIACTESELFIIIVDDGSTDDTATYAQEVSLKIGADHFQYHKNGANIGVNASWNVGLRTAMVMQIENICVANNDLLFTEGWDTPLIEALNEGGYWLVSPMSTEMQLPSDWPLGSTRHVNPVSNVMNILGACFAFQPKLIDKIGYFPEVCKFYYGDNFIQDMTLIYGLKTGHIYESYTHHFFCQTTKDLDNAVWFKEDTDAYNEFKKTLDCKFTIGLRPTSRQEAFEKYLKPSMDAIRGNYATVSVVNVRPADAYNEMIRLCHTPYLILMHEDVVFTPELLDSISQTIQLHPDFGVLGLVGPDSTGANKWADENESYEVETFDSCLIVIKKESAIRFNEAVFDDFHLYVEDYCAQGRAAGAPNYTIKLLPGTKIDHASATWHELGPCWGEYPKYREIFGRMWPGVKTT